MTQIVDLIRIVVQENKDTKVYTNQLMKNLQGQTRVHKITQLEIDEVIKYYEKLQVINVDTNGQITFL